MGDRMSLQLLMARARMNHQSAGGDPYWNNVASLLPFNQADGTTAIVDALGTSWTKNVGTFSLSNAFAKFGTTSAWFQSCTLSAISTSYIIGTGDFTIELWVKFSNTSTQENLFGSGSDPTSSTGAYFQIYKYDGSIRYWEQTVGDKITSGAVVQTTSFMHVAVTRVAGVIRLFVNGVLYGSYTNAASRTATIIALGSGGTPLLNTYLQDFRLTVGVGRYTANFTPPTAPFPNHA